MTNEMIEMSAVACHEREDCMNKLKELSASSNTDYSESAKTKYKNIPEIKKEKINKSKMTGTLIDFEDKCQKTQACFAVLSSLDKENTVKYNNIRDCISILRRPYDVNDESRRSHSPIIFPNTNKDKGDILCNMLLTIIANNRKIHRDYVSCLWRNSTGEGNESSVYSSIRKLLINGITHTMMKCKKSDVTSISEELTAIYNRTASSEHNGNLGKKIESRNGINLKCCVCYGRFLIFNVIIDEEKNQCY